MNRRMLVIPALVGGLVAGARAQALDPAEVALRERVQQFYQLQVDKKFRQAEAFVAEDTKDIYYGSKKGDLLGFSIKDLELLPGKQKARVTVQIKATMMVMGAPTGRLPTQTSATTYWKIENGQWVWYIDQQAQKPTPFGPMSVTGTGAPAIPGLPDKSKITNPDISGMLREVSVDKRLVVLTAEEPEAAVTLTNGMPGSVDVVLGQATVRGLTATIDKTELKSGEKAVLKIRRTPEAKESGNIQFEIAPWNQLVVIQIDVK